MSNSNAFFVAHDTEWLRLSHEVNKAVARLDGVSDTLMRIAGFKKEQTRARAGWFGKVDGRDSRVTLQDAQAILAADPDHRSLQYGGTNGHFLGEWEKRRDDAAAARQAWYDHEEAYTGWNRFFLVTTSDGHIHRSMGCPTCNKGRSTTGFAMLPQLSGTDAETAVKALGAALCSVCFPDAPVEWQDAVQVPATLAAVLLAEGPDAFNAALAKLEAKRAKAAAERCPGSGQYAPADPARPLLRYRRCPVCGTPGGHNAGKIVAHKAPR